MSYFLGISSKFPGLIIKRLWCQCSSLHPAMQMMSPNDIIVLQWIYLPGPKEKPFFFLPWLEKPRMKLAETPEWRLNAFMGSVPVATLGPSWPACWHKEFGGEINLEDNLVSLFSEVAWSSSLGLLAMINVTCFLPSPLLLPFFRVYFPTIDTVSLQSRVNKYSEYTGRANSSCCSDRAPGDRWYLPDYS